MVSRRALAVAELVASLLALPLARYLRKRTDAAEGEAESSLRWLAVGAVSSAAYHWLYDRDFGGIRRSRIRGAAASGAWAAASNRFVLGSRTAALSFSDGSLVGTIAYRLRYGLLRPVPGSDD